MDAVEFFDISNVLVKIFVYKNIRGRRVSGH